MDEKNLPFLTRNMLAFQEGRPFGIEIDIITDAEYIVTLKGFTKEGPFQYNTDGTQIDVMETFAFSIPDIPIMMTIEIRTLGVPMLYGKITAYLTINNSRYAVLMQGNLNGCDVLSWPYQLPITEIQKRGMWQSATGNNPAAGTYPTVTTDTDTWWNLKYVEFWLTTDANVANRQMILKVFPANLPYFAISCNVIQTASTTRKYRWVVGVNDVNDTVNSVIQSALPPDIWLPPRSVITCITVNKQAGDDFGDLTIAGEKQQTKTP